MNLSEKAQQILSGLDHEHGQDFYALESEAHPLQVMRACDAIRRFLQLPGTTGSIRPDAEFLSVLLAHGKEGFFRIYEAWVRETARTDDEAKVALGALATLAGHARSMRLISWDLIGVSVEAAKGKPKILIALPDEVDARLREVSKARGETLTGFVVEAVRDRLARIEKPARRAAEGADATAAATVAATAAATT